MDFDSSENSDALPAGKIKTQTFKQFQLERLIKEGKVIPAVKLAEAKEQALKRIRDFEEAAHEEQRQRRGFARSAPQNIDAPLTRERFEE